MMMSSPVALFGLQATLIIVSVIALSGLATCARRH